MKDNQNGCGNGIIFSYIGMGMAYEQGKLMYIAGKEDAALGDVGTLRLPVQAQGVDIDAHRDNDPALFSYVRVKGDRKSLRILLAKRDAPSGPTRFSVLVPSVDCCCDNGSEWVTWTADITLVDGTGKVVAFNPHALAQWGNFLYLVDFETTTIIIVDVETLETAGDNTALTVQTYDVTDDWNFSVSGRGQAVIALDGSLYALYIDADAGATRFAFSVLFRYGINSADGTLSFSDQTEVGINAQSIIPVNDGSAVQLLIPAIGGRQWYGGRTNGTDSNICYVPATGTWLTPAPVKIVGDPVSTPITAYDIHAVGAAMRDEDSAIFILTQIYTGGSDDPIQSPTSASWRIYRTTVGDFLGFQGKTISEAVTAGVLTVVDEGSVKEGNFYGISYGIYNWDILYEQDPGNDETADRLWVVMGSPILATHSSMDEYDIDPAYGSPTALFRNPFVMFGHLGGVNVNMGSLDLTIETLHQAKRGVSLKRTLRKAQAPRPTEEEVAAAQAKAAQAKGGKTT
jgi:hypothetical protein